MFLPFSGNVNLCLVSILGGHSQLCASACFVFTSYWPLPHLLWALSAVVSAQASSCSHIHQWSHPVTRLWAPSGPLLIPKTLHWCIQLLLSVRMWMSDTHPRSTGAKLLLQLPSPSCLLGLSQLKSEQLTATHPFRCSPRPYNLRVTHDSFLFLLISPLSLAPSTSCSSPLHPLSTSAIDSALRIYLEFTVFSPPASQTLYTHVCPLGEAKSIHTALPASALASHSSFPS